MRLLYLSQYFPPEAGATQTRAFEMARTFVSLGHKVTIVCEFPNHPSGIIPQKYQRRLYEKELLEGIEVLRVPVLASPVKDFRRRMLFYLSYMVTATLAGVFLSRGKYELIYATSPPLFTGAAGLLLSYWKHRPLVFEVRDLWPESAVALGELKNHRAIALATSLELACYRRACRIIVVTRGIQRRLAERGIPIEKITLIPNGASLDLFQNNPAARIKTRSRLGLEGKFVLIYAGIFGIAQGLEAVISAAKLLEAYPKIQFLMLGDGPQKRTIADLVDKYHLLNVTLLPEVPREQMPEYLSSSDLSLVPLKNLAVFRGALPSKIFDAWACQIPVLHSIDGEARQMVDQADGGVFVPPEDPSALAKTIIHLMDEPERLKEMGANGLAFVQRDYSRRTLAEKLAGILENEIDRRS